MLKKEIQAFFQEIRNGQFQKVVELVEKSPELVNVCSTAPPKKDDGQSPLQVAFKTGSFDIAEYLVTKGADVNFIENSTLNEWTTPVLHDCIRAVIFNSYTLQKNEALFEKGLTVLKSLLNKKANPNAVDSYGNNCLARAILDSKQMIENTKADLSNGILLKQLREVFRLLIQAGAAPSQVSDKRPSAIDLISRSRLNQYELF